MSKTTDFELQNEGSVFILRPKTELGRSWVHNQIGEGNGYQPYYPTVVIEHRYVEAIVEGLVNDSLTVA